MSALSNAPHNSESLHILIVARNALARIGLSTLLAGRAQVVGEGTPESDLIAQVERTQPDALLWDVDWEADVALLAALSAELPPILALLSDSELAQSVWACGVRGVLLRTAQPAQITAALVAVAHGLTVLEPDLAKILLPERPVALEEPLTSREREVLRLLSEGLANKGIAVRLGISENTVKFHVNAIMSKLGAQSRTEAVVRAARLGLIAL
ncbi:MAG: DNA-binding response regulator [Candidatus Thermofonsia Clade 1 bacterium]|uniref:DNA-binding response regulator n=1 Tax=Candidatus Thermofonsia Clade 1 bacterium TaxID=2364210 RepID=A0A2M8P1Y8_9CHLR|nr:MAG: DNA-binding response regulator [Candidatus Thermofonsia Clade 1 bacterium]